MYDSHVNVFTSGLGEKQFPFTAAECSQELPLRNVLWDAQNAELLKGGWRRGVSQQLCWIFQLKCCHQSTVRDDGKFHKCLKPYFMEVQGIPTTKLQDFFGTFCTARIDKSTALDSMTFSALKQVTNFQQQDFCWNDRLNLWHPTKSFST